MDMQIALLLGQDGIVNGAIYGLMALALVAAGLVLPSAWKLLGAR